MGSRGSRVVISALGGLLGGLTGACVVVAITVVLKATVAVVSRQPAWALVAVPLCGLALTVLVLYGLGRGETALPGRTRWAYAWRTFPRGVVRADLTDDMVDFAGEEERFPWRLAPIRLLAIAATVGLGGPLGTEKPAAYIGLASGAALADRGRAWRRLLRPAAVGGAAAGISALMAIPLVGPAYVLELGHRHGAPLSLERMTAGLVGGVVGWRVNLALGVDLFRLVVPKEPPHSFYQAAVAAALIGSLAALISSGAAHAIAIAKKWTAAPALRLVLGGLGLAITAVTLAIVADPSAAVGPGGGAISWVEEHGQVPAMTVLVVALLRAAATTAAVAAGGSGGLFVPYMAVGDLAGRVFAASLGVPGDVAGSAGAASGIAGGYGLPVTAAVVVLGQGGPHLATVTCLAAVVVSTLGGSAIRSLAARARSQRTTVCP
jgi:H+/Cl- antiporter ClcA